MRFFYKCLSFILFLYLLQSSDSLAGVTPSVLINDQDSVLFDLANSDCFSDKVEFPVYIKSDEDIYGIDFSLKYDITKITYDSLTILKPYLFSSIYYNPLDSTLRLSCFSIQPIENFVDLFSIRFRKLQTGIDSIGFNNVLTYLNGELCSNATREYLRRPAINPPGPLTITPGDSLMLQVNPLPGFSYLWSTGDTGSVIHIYGEGLYSVVAENPNGCTITTEITINQSVVLPVELLYFKGTSFTDYIELEWATASERDNDGFRLEKLSSGNWKGIGFIQGSGTSLVTQTYVLRDFDGYQGDNYYRLIQIDINGVEHNEGTIHVVHDNEAFTFLVFPNPATDILQISARQDSHFEIYNALGNKVFYYVMEKGISNIDITKFSPGNYFYSAKCANSTVNGSFIVY